MEMLISIVLAILILIVLNFNFGTTSDIVFKNIFIFLMLVAMFAESYIIGEKHGQKQALRGKFDYKMEVKYELKDSVYTPVDTTFTEIKH